MLPASIILFFVRERSTYEWFKGYEDLNHILTKYVRFEDEILMAGCGNSNLGPEMYAEGFCHITNIDFAASVIEFMSQRCKDMLDMKCMQLVFLQLQSADLEESDLY